MCNGNHTIANAVKKDFEGIEKIVRGYGGRIVADIATVVKDLYATVLANELRFFAVQANTPRERAMWGLGVSAGTSVVLSPEIVPSQAQLRQAEWQPVMYRRHLTPTLDRSVMTCAGLDLKDDVSLRWTLARALTAPERSTGVVEHMPYKKKTGVVRAPDINGAVTLDLLLRDSRSYAHCRENHSHRAGAAKPHEDPCARLSPGDPITYIPMWHQAEKKSVAFLVSRALPLSPDVPTRRHLSGVGFVPSR